MKSPHSDLPLLDGQHPLGEAMREEFARDGHVAVRGLASPAEVNAYRPLIRDVVSAASAQRMSEGKVSGYASFFTQVTNLWRLHDGVLRFVISRRFARVAAQLLGVRAVRLYHDQALFKPPSGPGTPWHQDQIYWPLATSRTVTMWMPLMDLTRAMGTMVFASGSHHEGPLSGLAISSDSDVFLAGLVKQRGFTLTSYDLAAGDATFHTGWTAHATHPNTGSSEREVMTIIYYEDGATIMTPDSPMRQIDLDAFHPGQRPGERAASALNPLLYSAPE
jgi:ectoine hydroxylase-related dioxygenase (phytanoyl-CoA dioxygenase family)